MQDVDADATTLASELARVGVKVRAFESATAAYMDLHHRLIAAMACAPTTVRVLLDGGTPKRSQGKVIPTTEQDLRDLQTSTKSKGA